MPEALRLVAGRDGRTVAGIRLVALLLIGSLSACATQELPTEEPGGARTASSEISVFGAHNRWPDPGPRQGFIRVMATDAIPEEPVAAEEEIQPAEPPEIDPARLPPELRPPDWPILPKEGGPDGYGEIDPLEGMNRVFFYANGAIDFLIIEPLARGFRAFVPPPARHAVSRAFDNLSSPIIFANDLFQGEMEQAGQTLGRFLVNSTIGLLGLFDVASELGIEGHGADFGQTLQIYGVGDGIYLVLPLLGPTTARDAVGSGVDSLVDPRTWLLGTTEQLGLTLANGVVRRESALDPVDFLVDNSEDNYEAVRAWVFQQRQRSLYGECQKPTLTVCPGFSH